MIRIIGDTHGCISKSDLDKFKGLKKEDIVIVAGDFGFVWDADIEAAKEKIEREFRQYAEFYGVICFVDGNHENFELLNKLPREKKYKGTVGVVDTNVYHLLRGETYTIERKKIFTFGGANSFDKGNRIPYVSWWKEEIPTVREFSKGLAALKKRRNKVDVIVTHTCSSSLFEEMNREGLFNYKTDSDERCIREYFGMIAGKVKFDKWLFGHFHEDYISKDKKSICLWNEFFDLE